MSAARALMPREHALWSWVGVPLFGALLLSREPATIMGCVAIAAAFLASNGLRAREAPQRIVQRLVILALASWAGALQLATWSAPLWPLGLGMSAGLVAAWRIGRSDLRSAWAEVLGIASLSAAGALLVLSTGLPWRRAALLGLSTCAWHVLGAWWINRQLAAVLSKREPHPELAPAAVLFAGASVLAGLVLAAPVLAALPLLYAVRTRVHAPVRSGADARRLGLTELAWALAVTAAVLWRP